MKLLPLAVGLALLSGFPILPGRAQPPLPAVQASGLTNGPPAQVAFLPLPGLALVEKNTYLYDAGTVDIIRTSRLERSFTLKNTTRQPISITRLRGSCGCETLLLLQGGAAKPAARLAPGEQATIHLTVALHAGQPGAVRKYVWVDGPPTASGQASPLATLEVDILLQQSVSFTPSFVDFGKVAAGAGARQSLIASFDPDLFPTLLLPGSRPLPLGSAGSDVLARPLGPVQRVLEGGKSRLHQTYQVILSPSAHAGQFSGQLWLDLPQPGGTTHFGGDATHFGGDATHFGGDATHFGGDATPPDGTAPASRVSLAVTGQIAGAIDALPASVFFGSLPAGKPVTRSVVLSLASSNAQSLSVTSSAPWLHAVLDAPAASGPHRLLSVTLTAQAPPGPLQGKVTVALSGGEHLDIPVVAELTK